MKGLWFGREVVDPRRAEDAAREVREREGDAAATRWPHLVETDTAAIAAELEQRRAGFTPEWSSARLDDPGRALIAVYAEQHAVVAAAIDDLPTKARVEHLRAAGVAQRAPRPLRAMLKFELSPSAPGGVSLGRGLAVLGRGVKGEMMPFETARDLYAVPAKLVAIGRDLGGGITPLARPAPDLAGVVHPFGLAPKSGAALWLGLEARVVPAPRLAIGVILPARGAPPAVSAGGLFTQPGAEPPRLVWEIYDGRDLMEAEVLLDETRSFTQSGVIELRVPGAWRPGAPEGAERSSAAYWIRCRLLDGEWPEPPTIAFLEINMVPAWSGHTVRDEVLETPTSPDPAVRRVLRTSHRPVLEGTIEVRIDEGGLQAVAWRAVDDLSQAGPDDREFQFDPATGTLTFGDERTGRGKPLPAGFRHVRATYRAAAESVTIAAGAITTLVGSAPFLTAVTNIGPAVGGVDVEPLAKALQRGPREIRARGRAVAAADYEALALRAPGADIRRAHAVGGLHPRFPGRPVPGVVGVFVIGGARMDGGPPIPTEATLLGVAEHLSSHAPYGAEIVAVAPRFHAVRVEASLELARGAAVTAAMVGAARAIDRWLDPVTGADGEGWPFGGTIHHDALVRFLLRELAGELVAIPRLVLVVDGRPSRQGEDVPIPLHDLVWPAHHELIPLSHRRSP
ncbi:MAG TPA: putative baseplate assembly protein [Kofleriaceae bacterium]|nr:putative baseplate assembly protein [Kofleriaceae bacterium]